MRKTVSRAVRHPARVLAVLAVLGAGALSLAAAGGTDGGPAAPQIACAGNGAYAIHGRVPADVAEVYLSYRDGASVETAAVGGAYRLLAPVEAGHAPAELLYASRGRALRVTLDAARFPRCAYAVAPRAVLAGHAPSAGAGTPAQRANALDDEATIEADRTAPQCKRSGHAPGAHVRYGDGTPEPAMLALLGVLRRPPTREELAAPLPFDPDAVLTVLRRYRRIVHVPGFGAIRVVVGVGHQWVPPMALPACRAAGDRILRRLLRTQPPAVRRLAWKQRRSFKLGPQTRGQHPWLDFMGGGGGTGGVFDAARFRTHGMLVESWSGGVGQGSQEPSGVASGLVPDGVATVTLRRARDGRLVGSGRVIQNAFAIAIPGKPVPPPGFVEIWRDRAGRTIRVVG